MKPTGSKSDKSLTMNIGELASLGGVTRHTVRYYEKIGILEENERAPNGYRVYTERDVYILRLARRAKMLGLSLTEIRESYQLLRKDPSERKLKENAIQVCLMHKEKTQKKIQELKTYQAMLEKEINRLKALL